MGLRLDVLDSDSDDPAVMVGGEGRDNKLELSLKQLQNSPCLQSSSSFWISHGVQADLD